MIRGKNALISRIRQYFSGATADSVLLTFVKLITVSLGILVTKLLSVHFSLAEYGTYSQAMLVVSTAQSISILGLSDAVNRFYNSNSDLNIQKRYVSTIFTLEYIAGIASALIILSGRNLLTAYFSNDMLSGTFRYIALLPLGTNLILMLQVLFVSIGKARILAVRNLIVSIVRLVIVWFACFITSDVVTIFKLLLLLDVVQILYFFYLFGKKCFFIRIRDMSVRYIRPVLAFGIPMSVYIMTNGLCRDADKYVVGFLTDTETLAVYSNAAKVLPFDMITASFVTVLIPIITRQISAGQYEKAKDAFKTYLRLGCITTFIIVFGAVIVSKELMLFLYDRKYVAGLSVFVVYLIVDMIKFMGTPLILIAKGKTKLLMLLSITALAVNVILNILLIYLFGVIGAAVATLAVTLLLNFALLTADAREVKAKWSDLFEWKEIIVTLITIFAVGAAAFLLKIGLSRFISSNTLVLIVTYIVYCGAAMMLRKKNLMDCMKIIGKLK